MNNKTIVQLSRGCGKLLLLKEKMSKALDEGKTIVHFNNGRVDVMGFGIAKDVTPQPQTETEERLNMKVTIENINGVDHTIVWHAEEERIATYLHNYKIHEWLLKGKTFDVIQSPYDDTFIASVLPPLPRKPTADDAELLDLYRAHGLLPCAIVNKVKMPSEPVSYHYSKTGEWVFGHGFYSHDFNKIEITHAVTKTGERVEVAIIDKEVE